MGSSVVVHSGFTSFMGFFVARVLVVENMMVFVLFCFVLFFFFFFGFGLTTVAILFKLRGREKERKRERKRDLVRGGINGEDRVTERKESEDTSLREKRKITNKANSV